MRISLSSLGVLCGLLLANPVAAGDSRLVAHRYNPDEVVTVNSRIGVQASIAFAEEEHIENVAIGDSVNWQVTPNKRANLLFVKPLAARARTNMTVVTDRHTYYFDLVAPAVSAPLYVLKFTYPDEPKPATPNPQQQLAGAAELSSGDEVQALANPPTDKHADPAELNFAWRAKGKANLLPARTYDDGVSTFVSWPVGVPLPAILVREDAGAEGPVNFAVRGDVIVIIGVPRTIVLRLGKDFATLENTARRSPAKSSDSTKTVVQNTAVVLPAKVQ